KTAKEDTAKVHLLLTMADQYESNNQDSSLFYLNKAGKLSQKLNFRRGLYGYYRNSLIIYYTKGDYAKALLLSDSAMSVARELKDSVKVVSILGN
ncbi:MAG TPA: hypothetical protein PLR98_13635, partial [Chitinophagaceae bacterium]|nr:hypothetical protein [Chitinophagaceae bacterium]